MAGSSAQVTYDQGYNHDGGVGHVRRIVIDWTSDDTTGAVTATTKKIVGQLIKVVTNPGATAPTDNYDIVISDADGLDLLSSLALGAAVAPTLANRDTADTEVVHLWALSVVTTGFPLTGTAPIVCSTLSVAVTNAGNSKQGQIVIYYVV